MVYCGQRKQIPSMDTPTLTDELKAAIDKMNRTTQDQIEGRKFLDEFLADPTAKKALLRGYAGTGKTWLIGDWLEAVLSVEGCLENVCIAAPTHKALDVLRQKCAHLPVVFKTLHSLLGLIVARREDGEIDRSQLDKDDNYTLLVVDEGSMAGEEFDQLITRELGRRIGKVLFVGDPAQLPPVKEDLSPVFKIERSFTLKEVVRYDNSILNVATRLRECITDQESFILPDLRKVCVEGDRTVSFTPRSKIYDWALAAFEKKMDFRILAWTNAMVLTHNDALHRRIFPNLDPAIPFHVGERILLNDAYTLTKEQGSRQKSDKDPPDSLYNGEVLTTVSCQLVEPILGIVIWQAVATREGTELEVILNFAPNESHRLSVHKSLNELIANVDLRTATQSEKTERLENLAVRRKVHRLAPLRHAYACTVHKSQGSTYDISIVDFADIYRSDDRARLLYVASTRPSQFLVFSTK